jgi:hypothetical protein
LGTSSIFVFPSKQPAAMRMSKLPAVPAASDGRVRGASWVWIAKPAKHRCE